MQRLVITDSDEEGFLTVGLFDILRLLGPLVANTTWEVSNLEILGNAETEELYRLSDTRDRVSGDRLVQFSRLCGQIIDGTFAGYREHSDHPWIVIISVDSSAYDIETDDKQVIRKITSGFRDVTSYPE